MKFVLLIEVLLLVLIHGDLNLNDECQVARTGINGICRYYEDCPVVLAELLEQGLSPNQCGTKDRKEIICCPVPQTPKPTKKTKPTNRISAKSKQKNLLLLNEYLYTATTMICYF